MEIIIMVSLMIVMGLMVTGRPIKIEITHKQIIPEAFEVKIEESDDNEKAKREKEMKDNALNIMKKFNEDWSGLTDGDN